MTTATQTQTQFKVRMTCYAFGTETTCQDPHAQSLLIWAMTAEQAFEIARSRGHNPDGLSYPGHR